MKRVYSFQELPKFLNSVAPAGFLVSVTANSISSLIKTTRGKEKLLALAQYISELIKLAMEDYVSINNISKQPLHLFNSIQIEKSMKNGRKLMRLLMFTDDLAYLEKLYVKKETLHFVTGLMVCVSLSNIVYYILDNLVWLSDIGIISKFVSHANIR